MPSSDPELAAPVARAARALEAVPGLVAVALGGSRARGVARPDSDWDLGLYYRADTPLDLKALARCAATLDPREGVAPTDFYEWGPWVNGGVWLEIEGTRVDWIYREVGRLEQTIDACERGVHEWHFGQQPPFGFPSHVLLAELAVAQPLFDPEGALAALRARVATYPSALRDALVHDHLWSAAFTLFHARKLAERGDIVNAAGCLTRVAANLIQAVYAHNRRWFVSDKGALEAIGAGWECPPGLAERLAAIVGHPGGEPASLAASVRKAAELHEEAARLFGAEVVLDRTRSLPR